MIKQSPLLDCLKSSYPLNVSPPWLLKFSSCSPYLAVMTQKSSPPPDRRGEDTMGMCRQVWLVAGFYHTAMLSASSGYS